MPPLRQPRHTAWTLAGSLALTGFLLLGSSVSQASPQVSAPVAPQHFWNALALEPQPADAWERLRDRLRWETHLDDPRVQRWIARYRASPHNVMAITQRARPWLAWILDQIEQRDLPGEIALIPFVESSFDPTARSHRGAAGLWQFMPGTAEALGLLRRRGYDGRLDVAASTQAALDYIELQAEQWYAGDIELSLAAYNAGAGTVNRARRAALAQGKAGDYWSLSLPGETMQYLPKLHALATIIADPEAYGIELPAIGATAAVAEVPVDRPLDLDRLALLAGVKRTRLAELNPGLIAGRAQPGVADSVLVPAERHNVVLARLTGPAPAPVASESSTTTQHVVQHGDTLSQIARRYGHSVSELREYNALSGDTIRVGQTLTLPNSSLAWR